MKLQFRFLRTISIFIALAWSAAAFGQGLTKQPDPAMASLGKGFVSETVNANGTTLHYVRGGTGPAIILLHGFPEDWSEFRKIMPRLAAKFTVVAVDLRGVGGSAPTPAGYDTANMAQDVYQLAQRLHLEHAYVVGHDIGGMVAYDFARLYPKATRGVMILDVPLPGIEPWEQVEHDPLLWHFGFHQTPKVPEELISGREFVYFRDAFFERLAFNKSAITDADIRHYANSYGTPEHLRAGLAFYRAFAADAKFNETHRDVIEAPFTLVGGDHAVGTIEPKIAESLRMHGCADVSVEVLKNSGHFVADEQPAALAELVERNAR
jgi:pimeloyl-ACP methyl ester carboxylesterase